jgi:hypothetical protein
MTPFRLSIRALPLMVNSIKFGILTRVSRTTASMRKHGSAGLNVPSDGQGNADHDLRIARAALTAKPWMHSRRRYSLLAPTMELGLGHASFL